MKKEYDVFRTFQAQGFDIYSRRADSKCDVKIHETETAVYYSSGSDAEAAMAFLERNRKRAEARKISEAKRKADNKLNPRVK